MLQDTRREFHRQERCNRLRALGPTGYEPWTYIRGKRPMSLQNYSVWHVWTINYLRCPLCGYHQPWERRCKATWKSGIQTLMAQGRSTTIISMIQWTRTSSLSIKISLSLEPLRRLLQEICRRRGSASADLPQQNAHLLRQSPSQGRFTKRPEEGLALGQAFLSSESATVKVRWRRG